MYLVTFTADYQDEFDVENMTLITDSEFEIIDKNTDIINNYDETIYHGFGTNFELEFQGGKELLECFEFAPITPEEVATIEKYLSTDFGTGNCPIVTLLDLVHELSGKTR